MKTLYNVLVAILILHTTCAFGYEYQEPTEINITKRLHKASYYTLPYWSDINGLPKYSGATGTYTPKHIPTAVSYEGIEYYTFSENSSGDLKLFVAAGGEKTLVHTISGVTDPHDNAVVNVLDGYVTVVVSARSNKRLAHIYKADKRNSIESFTLVNTGVLAYPQLWKRSLIYTKYTDGSIPDRELYSKNTFCDNKLVSGGHYSVSYEDKDWLHMAYNWHEGSDVDNRKNIYYMKTKDGCNWYNKDGEHLALPLEENSTKTLISATEGLVYMNDIDIIDGVVRILTVQSTSSAPSQGGAREVIVTSIKEVIEDTFITYTGHNYNSGNFVDGSVVVPVTGSNAIYQRKGYAGGDVGVFSITGNLSALGGYKYQYNYIKKVVYGDGAYLSETMDSKIYKGAYIRKITLE